MSDATTFGSHIRACRERLRQADREYSLRRLAGRLGVEPSYLSKIERDEFPPPSEEVIGKLAGELGEDRDVLLALAGKVSADLREAIVKRPALVAELIREIRGLPDHAVLRIVREVRDGDW